MTKFSNERIRRTVVIGALAIPIATVAVFNNNSKSPPPPRKLSSIDLRAVQRLTRIFEETRTTNLLNPKVLRKWPAKVKGWTVQACDVVPGNVVYSAPFTKLPNIPASNPNNGYVVRFWEGPSGTHYNSELQLGGFINLNAVKVARERAITSNRTTTPATHVP